MSSHLRTLEVEKVAEFESAFERSDAIFDSEFLLDWLAGKNSSPHRVDLSAWRTPSLSEVFSFPVRG